VPFKEKEKKKVKGGPGVTKKTMDLNRNMLKREIRKKDKIIGLLKVHISSRKKKLEMKIIPSFFYA
jgi:hypothetical protein